MESRCILLRKLALFVCTCITPSTVMHCQSTPKKRNERRSISIPNILYHYQALFLRVVRHVTSFMILSGVIYILICGLQSVFGSLNTPKSDHGKLCACIKVKVSIKFVSEIKMRGAKHDMFPKVLTFSIIQSVMVKPTNSFSNKFELSLYRKHNTDVKSRYHYLSHTSGIVYLNFLQVNAHCFFFNN